MNGVHCLRSGYRNIRAIVVVDVPVSCALDLGAEDAWNLRSRGLRNVVELLGRTQLSR